MIGLPSFKDIFTKIAKTKYFAYRNIHKGKGSDNHNYSLRNTKTGRVEKRGKSFIMQDVTFKVSDKGRERVRSEKRKNVHAGVVGNTYTGKKTKDFEWQRVGYNPYKDNFFTDAKGKRVDNVPFAKLTTNGVFIPMEKVANPHLERLIQVFPSLMGSYRFQNRLQKKLIGMPQQVQQQVAALPKAVQENIVEYADDAVAQIPTESEAGENTKELVANAIEKISRFKEQAKGGLADNKEPSDFDKKELAAGIKVEKEHTTDKNLATEIAMDHIAEHKDYYSELKKMENKLEKKSFIGMPKIAGGPGSGVQEDNTKKIDMPMTPDITIGKRTAFMNSKKPFMKNKTISMPKIKYVGQEKYVPKKLNKFIDAVDNGEQWPFEKAIDVTINNDGDYAVLDGHHRFLVSKHFKKKTIKANVYLLKIKKDKGMEKKAFNLSKIPGQISSAFNKAKGHIAQGGIKETAKDLGKGAYNMMLGGKTINKKWDPLYGVKSMGKAREQYTDGPLKGMYRYTKDGDHALDLAKDRNWKGFGMDEFHGASKTRGDLAAKQLAKKKDMNVGKYLDTASSAEKKHLQNLNQMKATEFMKKHPKLAANYYGRNVVQKGLTVGFPAMALHDVYSGAANEADPSSSRLGNTLGSLAEAGGWALTAPLGMAGALGAVTGLKGGAKMLGNTISPSDNSLKTNYTAMPTNPNMQIYDRFSQDVVPQGIQAPIERIRQEMLNAPQNAINAIG